MSDDKELEVTTPPEDVYKGDELDRFLAQTSTNSNKSYVVRDRTGLRLSFYGLLPYTTGDNGAPRIWGGSIILNSAELEFPNVHFKLRATAKKSAKLDLSCNRSKGNIKQNDIFVITYQLPETSIEAVQLTLIVDGNPHEVPLCKSTKADYFWLGKNTNVPDHRQLLKNRHPGTSPPTEPTPKHASPGRFDQLSDGLKTFLTGGNGLDSVFKLLHPHAVSLFGELSRMRVDRIENIGIEGDGNLTDVIAAEIVRRSHESNRQKFTTTPTLLQMNNLN